MNLSPLSNLHRWVERHDKALFLPTHMYDAAKREHDARLVVPVERMVVQAEIIAQAQQDLIPYARRRGIEEAIADYLDHHKILYQTSLKLRTCRCGGSLGYCNVAGQRRRVIAWDDKCGCNRLCPDEAREEQMRLAERYVPAIEGWRREARQRQVQYCVLTWPNIPAGDLAKRKRDMAKQVSKWIKSEACAAIKGALCVQEDPLAAGHDWNLHTNLILVIDGRFDWKLARAEWYAQTRHLFPHSKSDFQVHFDNVPPAGLVRAVLELIKYSAKHVTAKQLEDGEVSKAPGITDWPPELFMEWWEAGKRFRRTRSYGVLFRVPKPDSDLPQRDQIEWVGRISYECGKGYSCISSIPAHNSARDEGTEGGNSSYQGRTGPPKPQLEVLGHAE